MRKPLPVLLALVACSGEAPAETEAEALPYRGDALIVRLVTDAAAEHRVPRDVLLALGWAETRLIPRTGELPPGAHDADELGEDHHDEGAICGLFGLDQGSAREEAASLAGVDASLLCENGEIEADAAAARLRALAGDIALDDTRAWLDALDEWHPALAEAGFPYGDYVAEIMTLGFRGEDEVGDSIYLPPVDGLVEAPASADDVGSTTEYARPDTPLANWQGPACDYTPASRGPGSIRYVVIHTCEGGFAGCLSTVRSCGGSRVSAHYVTSYTGYAAQVVEENDIAWHVGCLNGSSVGIEQEGFAGSTHHPDAQMCRTARITRSVCDRYGIPCDRSHVIGHVEANRLYCHGDHWDPGPHWDWGKFMDFVRNGCDCRPSTEVCNGRDDDCDRRVDEGVTNRCGTCGPEPAETCNGRDDDCDGTVDENVCDRAAPSGDPLPDAIDLGTSVRRTITFRNDGTTTWRPAHYRIAASAENADVELSGGISSDVPPGGSASVELDVTPREEAPISVRLVVARDGDAFERAWTSASRGQRPAFGARFSEVSAPMVVDEGVEASGFVTVVNEGREPFAIGSVVTSAESDEPISVGAAPLPGLAPGESARVAVTFLSWPVRVETIARATLIVRDPDGASPRWPEAGRTVEIGIVPDPSDGAEPPVEEEETTLVGGCSASGGSDGAPWWIAIAAIALLARLRLPRRRLSLIALLLSGCAGDLCDSEAACATDLEALTPSEGSARGGEIVTIEGIGLGRAVGVHFGERSAAIVDRRPDRLIVRTPTALAGATDLVLELDDRGERRWLGAFTYEAINLSFEEMDGALPADTVEQRDGAYADFDGDHVLDLVVAVRGGVPRLYLGLGDGTFEAAPEGAVEAPSVDAVGIAIGDVDGDGDDDVFVPVYEQGQDLLLRSDGGRLVHDPSALPADASSDHAAALGDLDGDGDLDLVVGASAPDAEMRMAERVLLNDGAGVFSLVPDAIEERGDRTTGLALGDLDGDGDLDLVTANDGADDAHLRLLLGNGDGAFADAEPGALPSPADASRRPLLGDLDGDGDLDLLALGRGQDHLLSNDGGGHFYDATFLSMPTDAELAMGGVLADVDLDGDLDAVVANSGASPRLLVNEGGRMRDASLLLPPSTAPTRQVIVLDVDREGAPDLIWLDGEGAGHVSRASLAAPNLAVGTTSRGALTVARCSAGRGGNGWLGALLVLIAIAVFRHRAPGGGRAAVAALALLAGCAAPHPRVESLTPATISARGGDRIVLSGVDLDAELAIFVDGIEAPIETQAPGELVVRAPPLIAGTVPVELEHGGSRIVVGDLIVEPLPVRFTLESAGAAREARHVVLHDLDGDGDLDAAVALRDHVLAIYRNAAGFLADATAELVPAAFGDGLDLAVGDLNGDSRPDVYVGTAQDQEDRIFFQDAQGRFVEALGAAPSDLAATSGVALADVDDDGLLDVVTARWRAPEGAPRGVRVLRNLGGTFEEIGTFADDPTFGIAVADFDGDGHEDIFAANDGAPSQLFLGARLGRFLPTIDRLPAIAFAARSPASADVDGDGDADIVLAAIGQNALLRNDGAGYFGDATRFALSTRAGHTESITACDLDRDGDADLVGAGYGAADDLLALSDGGRWFADYGARLDMLPRSTTVRFAAGDLDADGDPDLVVSATGAPLRILRHEGGATGPTAISEVSASISPIVD